MEVPGKPSNEVVEQHVVAALRRAARQVVDTIDCRGLQLNKLDKKGNMRFTKYMTFAEHPEHKNELSYNLASVLLPLLLVSLPPSLPPSWLMLLNTTR